MTPCTAEHTQQEGASLGKINILECILSLKTVISVQHYEDFSNTEIKYLNFWNNFICTNVSYNSVTQHSVICITLHIYKRHDQHILVKELYSLNKGTLYQQLNPTISAHLRHEIANKSWKNV